MGAIPHHAHNLRSTSVNGPSGCRADDLLSANSGSQPWDAVGTLITERPPHRTVRAAFPHTAPTSGIHGSYVLPYASQHL